MEISEMNIYSEPGNVILPKIKIRFTPLDNPKLVIDILKGIATINGVLVGNNINTVTNRCAFYRQCFTGQDFSKFDELTQYAGIETISHLAIFLGGIHESFMLNKPLLAQTHYTRNYMRELSHATTCQYVGVVFNINNNLTKSPPNYYVGQKLSYAALRYPLLARFLRRYSDLLT